MASTLSRHAVATLFTISLIAAAAAAALVSAAPATAQTSALVYNEINKERASVGVYALRESSALDLAAARHNLCMARYNTLSHWITQCEPDMGTRITNAGLRWSYAAENLALTTSWPVGNIAILNMQKMMWHEGPTGGHYQNIVSTKATYVGVDVYIDNAHHKAWLTEVFARPM